MIHCSSKIIKELENLPTEVNIKTLTNKHTETIVNQIEIAIKSPICIPRFFFQILQCTSIKLSISPQPRIAGEAVIVQPGSNLVVKIEGVVQHYGKTQSLFRTVDSVQLTLVSQLMTLRPNELKASNETTTLTQTVKPHRDFLSGSFLLSLNNFQLGPLGAPVALGGQWQVTLEACVIDENGVLWNTGPKSTLLVRVPDDPSKSSTTGSTRRF